MQVVPAKNGWLWLARGAKIFARAPVGWMLLVFSYWVVMSLVGQVPVIGPVIGIVFVPAFGVSFLNIARESEKSGQIAPLLLFSGFRKNLASVITLGGIYLIALTLVVGVATLFDGGELARFLMAGTRPKGDDVRGAIVAALGYLPVLLAFWFAPPLAGWDGMNAAKALFYSFFAALRNWKAMFVYSLAIGVIVFGGTWLMVMVVQLLAPAMLAGATDAARGPATFLVFVFLPLLLAALSVLFASFYTSYRDVFAAQ
jgi:hypothetical protein